MTSYESNISRLRDAEEKAALLVSNAEASSEKAKENATALAREDIEKLRKKMTIDFESKKFDDSKQREEQKIKTQGEVTKNEELFTKNRDVVIDMLVDRVLAVAYELPKNVKKDYSELLAKH